MHRWRMRVWGGLVAAVAAAGPAPAQTFGPDGFGYTGNHVNVPGSFVTIKGNGGTLITPLTPADPPPSTLDDRFYSVAIPFNFPFYGTNNTTAFVSTNGFVSFGGTTNTSQVLDSQISASYTNPNFNSATAITGQGTGSPQVDRQIIAPHWDDMQFTGGQPGGIYTLNRTVSGHQELVLEWAQDAFFNSTTDGVSFQAILRDDGSMSFIYGDLTSAVSGNNNGGAATIGIHDLGGSPSNNRFLQWSFNTTSVSLNDTINITPSAVPEPGTLALCAIGMAGVAAYRRRRRTG
jgi:hypothetical protein